MYIFLAKKNFNNHHYLLLIMTLPSSMLGGLFMSRSSAYCQGPYLVLERDGWDLTSDCCTGVVIFGKILTPP